MFSSMNLVKTVPDPKIFVKEKVENKSANNIRMAAIYLNFRKKKSISRCEVNTVLA